MANDFYLKIPRRVKIFIIFLVIILAAYFVLRFLAIDRRSIPDDFLKARRSASLIAQSIVALSAQSASNIGEISALDKDRKYTEALALISQELERTKEARNRALELSVQLEIMAKNLSRVEPASASQLALQAVSSETALINRLITYNDYLSQLLEILREKFLEQNKNNGEKIIELINKINEETRSINELNQKFNSMMGEFDSEF